MLDHARDVASKPSSPYQTVYCGNTRGQSAAGQHTAETMSKPIGSVFAACCLALALASSVGGVAADEIRIAVATNFATPMNRLIEKFEQRTEHTAVASSASTGVHYAQIKNGAPFDVFFAADDERPRLLEREGVAVAGTRFLYATGRLALWSPRPGYVDGDGRVLEAGDFRFLSIANPDLAPYGAAARDVLVARRLWDALQPRLVRGQDIGQAFSFVSTGNAELGFVAWSQLAAPGAAIAGSYWLVPESLHDPIAQEAVLIRDSPAARSFLDFLKTAEAREIIRSSGYGP